ncbi:MAG: hypothetical protein ACI9OU_000064 [Candidatus Promineifilaceae bacterium]|jgi:alpha-2-macroglobulin
MCVIRQFSSVFALIFCLIACDAVAEDGSYARAADLTKRGGVLAKEGNWAEALDVYKQALDRPVDSNPQVVQALYGAHNCLNRLNRTSELDAFIADVVSVHSNDWRMLSTTAAVLNSAQHYGYMIAGEYQRGQHRGGGKAKNSYLRDRHDALSLKHRARALAREHATPHEYIREC